MRPSKYTSNVIVESPRERDLVVAGLHEYAAIEPSQPGSPFAEIRASYLADVTKAQLANGYYVPVDIAKHAVIGLQASPTLYPEIGPSGDWSAMVLFRSMRHFYRLMRAKQLDRTRQASGVYEDAIEELSKYEIR